MLKLRLVTPFLLFCLTAQSQVNHRFIDPLSEWIIFYTDYDGIQVSSWYTYLSFTDSLYEDDSIIVAKMEGEGEEIYIEDKVNKEEYEWLEAKLQEKELD